MIAGTQTPTFQWIDVIPTLSFPPSPDANDKHYIELMGFNYPAWVPKYQ